MSWLPLVAEHTRERVCREFDNLGPEACVAETTAELARDNPEILDMARRSAADLGAETMIGFAMFYRLLVAQSRFLKFAALPRVSQEVRARIARRIDERGTADFTRDALAELARDNPELLQMAHHFASRQNNYLATMQAFALLYAALAAQAAAYSATLH